MFPDFKWSGFSYQPLFGFQIDLVFECSVFEPPLYLSLWTGTFAIKNSSCWGVRAYACKNLHISIFHFLNLEIKGNILSSNLETRLEPFLFICPRWEACEHWRVWKWKLNLHLQSRLWWMDPDEKHFVHWQVRLGFNSSKVCISPFTIYPILTWNQSSSMDGIHLHWCLTFCNKPKHGSTLICYLLRTGRTGVQIPARERIINSEWKWI